MSETTSSVHIAALPEIRARASTFLPRFIETADTRILCVVIFVASVGVMLLWRLFRQAEEGDAAIWDYIAQAILRGEVPYRDVVEIKGPASAYLSALAMWLGKFAGLRDLLAVRFMQIALAGVLSVVTFLVAEVYLRRRLASLIAFLLPLMTHHFVSWAEGGTQPKLTMILFGMLAILLIAKDRPFMAGVCSMLSCLCWQPGLLFTGVAVLIFSRYLTTWRDWRALKVLAGATLPLVVVGLYFYRVGALTELWAWTVAYNFEVYAPEGLRSPGETLMHVWTILVRVFRFDILWFAMGLAGLLLCCSRQLRAAVKGDRVLESPERFKDALLIAPIVYIVFCLINLQSGPDLIPLFPFFAIFAGWLITEIPVWLCSFGAVTKRPGLRRVVEVFPVFALSFVCVLALVRAATSKLDFWSLWQQDTYLKAVSDLVGPGDKIYVHGAVEILLLLNRPNLNPYIMWDHGKARYVAARTYGGSIDAMVDAIEAERPKVVVISRLRRIPEGVALGRWLELHYDRLPTGSCEAYLRKQ